MRGAFGRMAFGRGDDRLGRAFGRNSRIARGPNILTPARLGPHAVTFSRASQAFDPWQTSENLLTTSEPVDGSPWNKTAGPSPVTWLGNGTFGNLDGARGDRVTVTTGVNTTVYTSGRALAGRMEVKAPDASQVGKLIRVYIKRIGGTYGEAGTTTVTLTADWQEVIVTGTMTGDATTTGANLLIGNTEVGTGFANEVSVRRGQLEYGSTLGPYIQTTGRAIPRYHRDNDVPRARQIGAYHEWQLEPSRTNVFLNSGITDVTDSTAAGGTTLTKATHTITLDGKTFALNGVTLDQKATTDNVGLFNGVSISNPAAGPYALSFYCHANLAGDLIKAAITCVVGGTTYYLDNSASPVWTATFTEHRWTQGRYLTANVWQRVHIPIPAFPVGTVTNLSVASAQQAVANFIMKFAQLQVEAGAFPTSPIITTTAAVTRVIDDADVASTLTAGDMLLATESFTTGKWSYSWVAHAGGAYQVPNSNGVILLQYGRTLTAAEKQSESDKLEVALIANGQQIDPSWT